MVAGVALVALVATGAGLSTFVVHGTVTAESLAVSLAHAADSSIAGADPRCARRDRAPIWICFVSDPEASGFVRYRVTVRPDSSCWDAVQAPDPRYVGLTVDPRMPASASDCVRLWQPLQLGFGV